MGKISSNPGMFAFLRPFPVLEISTGATSRTQGQYAYSLGRQLRAGLRDRRRLIEKMYQFPGFMTVSSDLREHSQRGHRIRRDQTKMYGVSEARI
jgi:hypothetical protein